MRDESPLVVDMMTVDLTENHQVIYSVPTRIAPLPGHDATGGEWYVVEYPPLLQCARHCHSAGHALMVLAGELDLDGRILGRGTWAYVPGGVPHAHRPHGDAACRFIIGFDGTFDVFAVD